MKSCKGCGTPILWGGCEHDSVWYCSEICLDGARGAQFCEECKIETLPITTGYLHRTNGMGFSLWGKRSKCSKCHAVVSRVWYTFFFFPLLPLGRYRVLYIGQKSALFGGSSKSFYSRLLRSYPSWGTSQREMKTM